MIQQQCTGLVSMDFNSKYVVPSFLQPWNYETGNVTFSNESTSAASNGTKVPNIDNPCWRDSPKQELYCQFNSQTSLLGMQLAILFTAWQGLSLFIEPIIPWLARVAHRRKEASLLREQGLSKAQQKDAHLRHCQVRDEFHLHNPDNKGLRYVKLVV